MDTYTQAKVPLYRLFYLEKKTFCDEALKKNSIVGLKPIKINSQDLQ